MAPLTDQDLRRWASEHLVYEVSMLAYVVRELAFRDEQGIPRDRRSNLLLEGFVVHVRCLTDFLWGTRRRHHRHDAFAADFCEPDVWKEEGPERLAACRGILDPDRTGREVVHLSYHRLGIPVEKKEWDISTIYTEITFALHSLARLALPSRMNDATRRAISNPPLLIGQRSALPNVFGTYSGGTIPTGFLGG